jgi:hypothetical protein
MTVLDLLAKVGRAPRGARFLVMKEFGANPPGWPEKPVLVPEGSLIEVVNPHDHGMTFFGVADICGALVKVVVPMEAYGCLVPAEPYKPNTPAETAPERSRLVPRFAAEPDERYLFSEEE